MKNFVRFVIRCDMEGVTGVVNYRQVEPGMPEYAEARENFMQEIIALVEGLKEGGADEVVIYDEHWFGRNLEVNRLPAGVRAICGKPPYREDWAGGLDASCRGLILHGLHSRAGSGELLHHTYEPDISKIEINGVEVGEIGVEAAIAGDFRVPTRLVIADSAGVAEAAELIPNLKTVVTKISQSPEGADCSPLEETVKRIRQAARDVAMDPVDTEPFRFVSPVTMKIHFNEGRYLDALRRRAADRMVDQNCLELEAADNVNTLWARYWKLKLLCQQDAANAS